LQGIVPWKKEGVVEATVKKQQRKQIADRNKTNKKEHGTNHVQVQQNLIIELQILKRNLCEEID
jgi:hypothetical protein